LTQHIAAAHGETAMLTCGLCYHHTELDDAVVLMQGGACICLRCYGRETRTARAMPRMLRRMVDEALAELDAA
jgi:hypothetical protein